jgi:GNAT superfamily N-acetyltransferase
VDLEVRSAEDDDVDEVIAILAEVAAWLKSKGITQWPERFPRDIVVKTMERRELFVARIGAETIATITLQWSDPPFWGNRDDAGFVHRLAVRRSHVDIGRGLIAWAERQAASRGCTFLCLDCLASNARLRKYYEELGFRAVGEITGPSGHPHSAAHGFWRAVLYERSIELG